MRIFFLMKRPNYLYCHPLSITLHHHCGPLLAATGLPPSTTSYHPPPPDHHQSLPFAKGVFRNVQNIPRNSIIHLSIALKNTCLGKLFLGIIFLEILFPKMKVQTSYQTPLKPYGT